MDLWIRSQDKECLTLVDHLFTNDNCEIKQQNDLVLGTYKTKERALEILDEIQNILEPHEYYIKTERGTFTKTTNVSTYVYEMPEE